MPASTGAGHRAHGNGRGHHEKRPGRPRQPDAATADAQTRHAASKQHERSPPVTSAPATARRGPAHSSTTTRSAEHIGWHAQHAGLSTIRGRHGRCPLRPRPAGFGMRRTLPARGTTGSVPRSCGPPRGPLAPPGGPPGARRSRSWPRCCGCSACSCGRTARLDGGHVGPPRLTALAMPARRTARAGVILG